MVITRKYNISLCVFVLIAVLICIFGCNKNEKIKQSKSSEHVTNSTQKISSNEWLEFESLYTTIHINNFTGKMNLISKSDSAILSNNEAKAWSLFLKGVSALQDSVNRTKASLYFHTIVDSFPKTYYAKDADELAIQLRIMIKEDSLWHEASNLKEDDIKHKIVFNIYHLRNVNTYQIGQPGICSVFTQSKDKYNSAIILKNIGETAVPYLIKLLNDRRPICSIGYWRDYYPTRTVLRYQDAAIEILSAILHKELYKRTNAASYFSMETPFVRDSIINNIKHSNKT